MNLKERNKKLFDQFTIDGTITWEEYYWLRFEPTEENVAVLEILSWEVCVALFDKSIWPNAGIYMDYHSHVYGGCGHRGLCTWSVDHALGTPCQAYEHWDKTDKCWDCSIKGNCHWCNADTDNKYGLCGACKKFPPR